MTAPGRLADDFSQWAASASLRELEVVLRALADELLCRAIPDTVRLYDVARMIELYRDAFGTGSRPIRSEDCTPAS